MASAFAGRVTLRLAGSAEGGSSFPRCSRWWLWDRLALGQGLLTVPVLSARKAGRILSSCSGIASAKVGQQPLSTNQLLSVSPTLADLKFILWNTILVFNAWEKIVNIQPRLSVPDCMGPSEFVCVLGDQEPQTWGLSRSCVEAAQRRMRRCWHPLVAL